MAWYGLVFFKVIKILNNLYLRFSLALLLIWIVVYFVVTEVLRNWQRFDIRFI